MSVGATDETNGLDLSDEDEGGESPLEAIKRFIKVTGHDDIREALFQFIQTDPSGPEKFLRFIGQVCTIVVPS